MKKQEIIDYFFQIDSREELAEFDEILRRRCTQLTEREVLKFNVGDKVSWEGKSGEDMSGIVEKINRKTIKVNVGENLFWRVSPSFLKKEE